jgi:hypothetical protein
MDTSTAERDSHLNMTFRSGPMQCTCTASGIERKPDAKEAAKADANESAELDLHCFVYGS